MAVTFQPDPAQRAALQQVWRVWEPVRGEVARVTREAAERLPEFGPLLARLTPAQLADEEEKARELQRRAFEDGEWQPYLDHLRLEGARYARMGLAFSAWFSLLTTFRQALGDALRAACRDDPARAGPLTQAMNAYVDLSMAHIGEAYLSCKEEIIEQQQAAIRELSTPVLQVRDRLLIIPVVGMVDTLRARHLAESMLEAIRARRARAVVMDITGVPVVDSKVANHLVQACEAARLMGTRVILTGVSPEIAQALVTIGADLPGVRTVGDLQSGLEDAERLLQGAHPDLPAREPG